MAKITPSSDRTVESILTLDFEGAADVSDRFQGGFSQFIHQKKIDAINELLVEEFPQLSPNKTFAQKVYQHLGDDVVEEKRFVFLSLNPKFKNAD